MPGQLRVHTQRHAIAIVGSDVAVQGIGFAFREIGRHALPEGVELGFVDGLVRVVPVDVRLTRGLADEELVFGRAPGMRPRVDDELAVLAEYAFAPRQRLFDELGNREVLPQLRDLEFLRNRKNDGPSS
jgi:hypothetical protein